MTRAASFSKRVGSILQLQIINTQPHPSPLAAQQRARSSICTHTIYIRIVPKSCRSKSFVIVAIPVVSSAQPSQPKETLLKESGQRAAYFQKVVSCPRRSKSKNKTKGRRKERLLNTKPPSKKKQKRPKNNECDRTQPPGNSKTVHPSIFASSPKTEDNERL
jgi:hypothetical protein